MFADPPWPFHLVTVATRLYHPPSISCTFEFNRSTPRTFYPPHIHSLLSQPGLLFPSLHVLPSSRSFKLTFVSCIPYHLSTHLPIYPLTHTPHPQDPLLVQQIHFSKHARAKTCCLKYSLPPAALSLSLPRRRVVCYFLLVVFAR